MIIKGLQPLSVIDYPKHVAAVIFTAGCNMRCPFCHNAKLAINDRSLKQITGFELFSFLEKRKGLLDGICITGGEPTIHKDLPELISRIKELGFKVKLDSNGTNPDVIKHLLDEKLIDYIAMDIKQAPAKYSHASGVTVQIDNIVKSIALIKESGIPHEFRTTVLPQIHSEQDILDIAKWLDGSTHYSLQRFVPNKDMFNQTLTEQYPDEFFETVKEKIKHHFDLVEIK